MALIRLQYVEGPSYPETGSRLNMSAEPVRELLTRTLRKFGRELATG